MRRYAGFSLIELSIALGVMAVLASSIVPVAVRSVQIRAGEKTALEMNMIQEASRNFYADQHNWPADISILKAQGYLNEQWNALNPWNNPYQITSTSFQMTVSTQIPVEWSNLVASHLPASVVNGLYVSSTVSAAGNSTVASGVIVAWKGAIADIPDGWALCDGNNGTPDLRDKFIVGASQDETGLAKSNITGSLLQTGGSTSHIHGASQVVNGMIYGATEPHQLTTAEMPAHQHASWGEAFPGLAPWGVAPGYGSGHIGDGNSDYDNYYFQTEPQGGNQPHTHGVAPANHVPPFYALAFIMKL